MDFRARNVPANEAPTLPLESDFRHAQRAQVELCELLVQKPPQRRSHRQAMVAPGPNASIKQRPHHPAARTPVRRGSHHAGRFFSACFATGGASFATGSSLRSRMCLPVETHPPPRLAWVTPLAVFDLQSPSRWEFPTGS